MKTFNDYLRGMLVTEEGRRFTAYPDPLTGGAPWTIGVGHTGPEVHEGLTWAPEKVEAVFIDDLARATEDAVRSFSWLADVNDARRAVVIGMVFQMGLARTLRFVKALAAMREARWAEASGQMLDSKWAKQTPKRATRMARQIETGAWQYAPLL